MKTLNKTLKTLVLSTLLMAATSFSFAQGMVDSLSQDESQIISAIAPYSSDMRAAILNVAQYPQVLVKLERVQARTSQSFQDLIASYPREEQEKFYQVTRFPDLTNTLTTGNRKSVEEVKALMKDYPENIQQQILAVYQDHFNDLVKINDIYQSSQATVAKLTAKYPAQVQEDFKKVIETPDVMNLLTDHIDLTVSLGESYKNDPGAVTQQLDDLNKQLTSQDAKDLQDYKDAVAKDPKLQTEMKTAAGEFAQQYDQDDTNPTYVANNTYDNYPYPYWYGYPYWYTSPMWYPTPFYYQTGFYYGPGGGLVVVGLPSRFYANWFFGYGYHHYPGLYNHYNAYYNVHRTDIIRRNVFRGFNNAAYSHFSGSSRPAVTGGRNRPTAPAASHQNARVVSPARSSSHVSQMNVRPGNFNTRGYEHFNASSFHSSGWQGVRGGGSFNGGGGFHGGGMHGRR
ncbi:MAG TPA: hypothetical protein VIU12_01530 [Chryseolinea sp.]